MTSLSSQLMSFLVGTKPSAVIECSFLTQIDLESCNDLGMSSFLDEERTLEFQYTIFRTF